jgi:hypothetical protein
LDKEGRALQQAAVNIASEFEITYKHMASGELAAAGTYLMDIMTQASRIGTTGSLKRLYLRKPEVAKVLDMIIRFRSIRIK